MGRITAIVLAAGRSSRMAEEGNKLLLPWEGKQVVQVVVETLKQTCDQVVVVVGHEKEKVCTAVEQYGVCAISNPDYAEGMSTSIRVGVEASDAADGYLLALGDMPQISTETIADLIESFGSAPVHQEGIHVPTFKGRRGHPVLFGSRYAGELVALKGDTGARSLLEHHATRVVEIAVNDAGILQDFDTPENYAAAVG